MRSHSAATALVLLLCGAAAAPAATISIASEQGTLMSTEHGIRADTSTTGVDLAGMLLRVGFADGAVEDLVWEAYDPYTNGGTTTTGFSLSASWDGFRLTTSRVVTSMTFFAATANSIFDILETSDGEEGATYSTKRGFPFEIYGGDPVEGDIRVTYSNAVVLAGHPQGADAFTDMAVDFSGVEGGGFSGYLFFNSDLDTLAVAGDLVPVPVPLPAGAPLLLGALGGLALLRRRAKSRG